MKTAVMTLISLDKGTPIIRHISKNEPNKKHIETMITILVKELKIEGKLEQTGFKQQGKFKVYHYNVGDCEVMAMVERSDIVEYPKL